MSGIVVADQSWSSFGRCMTAYFASEGSSCVDNPSELPYLAGARRLPIVTRVQFLLTASPEYIPTTRTRTVDAGRHGTGGTEIQRIPRAPFFARDQL